MKKVALMLLGFLLIFSLANSAFAYDNHGYPYNYTGNCLLSSCPVDAWSFYQNNCTSYCAYRLQLYVYDFKNSYLNQIWSDGGNWDDAARNAGISVDGFTLPFDIAYSNIGTYGHVAFVEKVYFDSNGNPTNVDVTEYNYPGGCIFGQRKNVPIGEFSGFIHIAAFREGVDAMTYLDSYEMNTLVPLQTKDEWKIIMQKVWSDYRCKNCTGNYCLPRGLGEKPSPSGEDFSMLAAWSTIGSRAIPFTILNITLFGSRNTASRFCGLTLPREFAN